LNTGKFKIYKETLKTDKLSQFKEKVESREVYMDGRDLRKRMNNATGVIGFGDRKIVANKSGIINVDAKAPKILTSSNKKHYSPAIDHLDGYTQFPRPIVKPYDNKIDYTSEVKCNYYIPKQQETLSMIRKPNITEGSRTESRAESLRQSLKSSGSTRNAAAKEYFIYDSKHVDSRMHEPKVKRDILSQTVKDF
jgi:hypothetical protein